MGRVVEKINYVFLHGFLGVPEDWNELVKNIHSLDPKAQCHLVDYFKNPNLSPKNNFHQWTENFLMWLEAQCGNEPILLFGYSLGGRLALHAFDKKPERFQKLFLFSANPGLPETQQFERSQRIENDQIWARRFLVDSWSDLMSGWNSQAVFVGSKAEPRRDEPRYRRDLLSKALTNWSVGLQKDLRPVLKENAKKVTWVVGDLDKTYIQMTKDIFKICPEMNYFICPQSGHRVLHDQPIELYKGISKVLNQVYNPQDPE